MNKIIQGMACVVYPESCDIDNIYDYIFPNFPCALSPLHNRDLKPDGDYKKPHYHLLFKGKLTEKNKTYIGKILNVKYFENIYDFTEYYHYLYHFSFRKNEWIFNKAAYWKIDIKHSDSFNLDDSDNIKPLEELKNLCDSFYEISDFSDFIFSDRPELVDEFLKHFHFFDRYINSKRYRHDNVVFHTYQQIINDLRDEIKEKNSIIDSFRSVQYKQISLEDFIPDDDNIFTIDK